MNRIKRKIEKKSSKMATDRNTHIVLSRRRRGIHGSIAGLTDH